MSRFAPLLFVLAAFAQGPRASITGTITDPDGRQVATAPVHLVKTDTGPRYETVTSKEGMYSFSGLAPGKYDLAVPDIGFSYARYERQSITLTASQMLRLDLRIRFAGSLGTVGDDDSTILRSNRPLPPAGPAPRMPDGHPDLSGVWNGQNDANPEKPSVLPWAQTVAARRNQKDNPSALCLPGDVLLDSPNPFEILQTPQEVLIIGEYNVGALREIFLDGRPHPSNLNPTWMGHSTGRWDGDALVVDTAGFNDRSWLDLYPHTEMLHVVTRYRRPDLGHLDVEIRIEDPGTFTQPWNVHAVWDLLPGEELQEFICNENNKDPQHMNGK